MSIITLDLCVYICTIDALSILGNLNLFYPFTDTFLENIHLQHVSLVMIHSMYLCP